MKKNGYFDGPEAGGERKPGKDEIAAAWDVAIRAHYLAHEMRFYCAIPGLPGGAITRLAAVNLEQWATRFGAELEGREAPES